MTLQDSFRFTTESLNNLANGLGFILPSLIFAIIVFLIGLVVAGILMRVWEEIAKAISLEKSLGSIGAYADLIKSNRSYSISEMISNLIWWLTVLTFSIAALKSLGVKEVDEAFSLFFNYLPKLTSGTLVLIVGSVFAMYAGLLISLAGTLLKLSASGLVAKVISLVILVFSVFSALTVFGVASDMQKLLAQVAIVASGLAFALGGKDIAAKQIEKLKDYFK